MADPAFNGIHIGIRAIAVAAFGNDSPSTIRHVKHLVAHPNPERRLPTFRWGDRPASSDELLAKYRAERIASATEPSVPQNS